MPSVKRLSRIGRSVFARLLMGILAAILLINLVVYAFFGYFRVRHAGTFDRLLTHYVDMLAVAIGDPPDAASAAAIAGATGFVITYHGDHGGWTAGGDDSHLPPAHRFHTRRIDDRTTVGFYRGHLLITRAWGKGDLVFSAARSEAMERRLHGLMVVVLAALTTIVLLVYLFIRRIFKPLRGLRTGVSAVHAGRLDHRVPVGGAQEFRDLAEAFNDMTARVQETLASKERLLLDVSHELRSPITRMKLSAELLPDGNLKTSLAEDLHEMETMVSTILASARLAHTADALNKETVNIEELILGVANAFDGRAPGIDVAGGPDVACFLDRERMRTVIRNLLDNALKYSAPDSPPVIVAWRAEEDIVLSVADRGVGISPDAMHRVFDPFFREDDSRSRNTGGFGLGLSLCKAIVSAHGGTIDVSSAPGEGTTVTLRLPKN